MKKSLGVLVIFFVTCGFVMAQNVTVEWATVDGKPNIKFTNKTTDAQTVQYTVAGDSPAPSIDIPPNTEVTLPYGGKNPNAKIDPPIIKPAAKPKALPKGATSVSLGGAAPAPATPAPKAGTAAPATPAPKAGTAAPAAPPPGGAAPAPAAPPPKAGTAPPKK